MTDNVNAKDGTKACSTESIANLNNEQAVNAYFDEKAISLKNYIDSSAAEGNKVEAEDALYHLSQQKAEVFDMLGLNNTDSSVKINGSDSKLLYIDENTDYIVSGKVLTTQWANLPPVQSAETLPSEQSAKTSPSEQSAKTLPSEHPTSTLPSQQPFNTLSSEQYTHTVASEHCTDTAAASDIGCLIGDIGSFIGDIIDMFI